ncbi:hypothetical protein SAMN05444166_5825 [Singulisphaera sp. GP187]|uniref:hypothetical protein n=1 Tax=Singulisphaera sp. GP187 TaxID=1882752 RepID=UPI00092770BF|nr:hypothetical protein [Singulisphaera sp. GP187]SIO58828.1 hypothetical protein SAMN05444166_5825 [Singulisphaera sp. GP187]
MGGFYSSIQVRGEDHDAVRGVLERLARTDKDRYWVGPALGGWVGVYPSLHVQDSGVTHDLARSLRGELISLFVYDDDIFAYECYRDGQCVDRYNSRPDMFGLLPESAREPLRGRPEMFEHLATDPERFAQLRTRLAEQQSGPVVFASELLTLIAAALGIENVQTSYEYLIKGENDVEGWDRFVHIPDLRTEQARHHGIDKALQEEARRLLREGLLLAELGGRRSRAIPSPHWCPAPDGAGFLVAWAPAEFTSLEAVPLERCGPPWSAGPIATGLTIDPKVWQLAPSPSGRYLAIACTNSNPRGAAWDLVHRRCVARMPDGYSVLQVDFLPDESAMVCVASSLDEGVIGIVPLGPGEPRLIAFSRPNKRVAVHPAGGTLAVLDGRNRLSVLELTSGQVDRARFVGGIRPPIDLAYLLGPDYPRDWLTFDAETFEEVLRQREEELLRDHESQIRSQPAAQVESLMKESRARIGAAGRHARVALAETRSPGWLEEKAFSSEFVVQLAFDPAGERLFAATLLGVRVYRWHDVLAATGAMPPPALAVDLEPWFEETPEGPVSRNSFVAALTHDPERDRLLFGGQEGLVRYLDLADGRTGVLVEPPGRKPIGHLALSRDRTVLGVTSGPDINEEGPTRRAATIQFWDYSALCRRL